MSELKQDIKALLQLSEDDLYEELWWRMLEEKVKKRDYAGVLDVLRGQEVVRK